MQQLLAMREQQSMGMSGGSRGRTEDPYRRQSGTSFSDRDRDRGDRGGGGDSAGGGSGGSGSLSSLGVPLRRGRSLGEDASASGFPTSLPNYNSLALRMRSMSDSGGAAGYGGGGGSSGGGSGGSARSGPPPEPGSAEDILQKMEVESASCCCCLCCPSLTLTLCVAEWCVSG
jgi:hypothetical protein